MDAARFCLRLALAALALAGAGPAAASVDACDAVAAGAVLHLPEAASPRDPGGLALAGSGGVQRAIPGLVARGVEQVVIAWDASGLDAPLADPIGAAQWRDELVASTARSLDLLLAAGVTPVVVFSAPSADASPRGALASQRLEDLEWDLALEAAARDVAFVERSGSAAGE